MKKLIAALTVMCAIAPIASGAAKDDPTLLTINGKDVPLSEFEYLYNKSNSQQPEAQPVEEYLDMFVNFKLKVAEAEAARLDTTPAFRSEFTQYRRQLGEPYLIDSAALEKLVQDVYARIGENVWASHIMMVDPDAPRVLDSLRTAIVAGEITFDEAAEKYSIDKASARYGGRMGLVAAGATPPPFEEVMYATAVGEYSPVVNSGVGFHIIRVDDRQPAKGEVKASHILKLTKMLPDDQKEQARRQIDSIYDVLVAGADFAEVAARESQDPGSARNGGSLGWFGQGRMVQPFDSISFAMKPGEISRPFETDFGYHIIYKEDERGVQPLDSLRGNLLARFDNDGRTAALRTAFIDSLQKAYNTATSEEAYDKYLDEMEKKHPAYRNLLNEYRDGMLLFEMSNARVWDKASADNDALEAYFEENRGKYTWEKPRYKGYIISATSDSVLTAAMALAESMPADITADSVARDLRAKFGKEVKVERVLNAKGDNKIVDHVVFGRPKAAGKSKWVAFSPWRGRMIDAPESMADVRGAVTTDYQARLEAEWLDELHKKYPVKINKKVLKKVKSAAGK